MTGSEPVFHLPESEHPFNTFSSAEISGFDMIDGFTIRVTEIRATLDIMKQVVYKINLANGWFDEERTVGDDIALLHSEVSEAFEAFRNSDPENFAEELADILIRLLDTVHRRDVDLALAFSKKCAKNLTRGYKHGGKRI